MPEPIKTLDNITGHLTRKQRSRRERAERRLSVNAPEWMRAPKWLSHDARAVFYKTKKRLCELGLLDVSDVDLLASYARAIAEAHIASGREARDWLKLALSFADKLGIGAPARARLARKQALEPEDELERELKELFGERY